VPNDAVEPASPFVLLLVGTENVRRAPLAERLGAAHLADVLGEGAAATFRVMSAGTRAVAGAGMDRDAALVLHGLGGDPAGFRAQPVSPDMVAAADLTLTMTRQDREDVLALAPRHLARTFTLLEAYDLARRLDLLGGGGEPAQRARGAVPVLAAARVGRRVSEADDVPDPAGRSTRVHQEVGETVAGALLHVLDRLLGVPEEARSTPKRSAVRRRPNRWWRRPGS
jgi:protein-tyrosine-phosphatase